MVERCTCNGRLGKVIYKLSAAKLSDKQLREVKHMKNTYIKPEIETVKFDTEDIIQTSIMSLLGPNTISDKYGLTEYGQLNSTKAADILN